MFGSSLSDKEIITQIKQGNQQMLILLYSKISTYVGSYIRNNGGQTADVEDMLQDGLVVLWQNANKPDFELTSSLKTYLFAIIKNLWLKKLRKEKRTQNDPLDSESKIVQMYSEEAYQPNDQKQVVMLSMRKLDETCRKLLTRFYFDEWDMEKIAADLGFSNAQTAKAKKYQCKKKLEEIVKLAYTREDLM